MSDTALILVDIQNDYFDTGAWPVAQMVRVADNAAALLARARQNGDVIVHVRHENPVPDAPFFRAGTLGADIHTSVAPTQAEAVMTKTRANSFAGTDLQLRLQASGVQNLIICGAMSQMCIDATARAASDFGYQVTVAADACGAKETRFGDIVVDAPLVHAAYMASLAMAYAKVSATAEILGQDQ